MRRPGWPALAVLLVLTAGCADVVDGREGREPTREGEGDGADASMVVRGIVQDDAFAPVPGASVTVVERNRTTTTDADGRFAFDGLPVAFHTVRADAPDLRPQTLTARPGDEANLLFTLARFAEVPFNQTVAFHGIIRCAAEYLIITPSCDTITEYAADQGVPLPGGGNVVDDESSFDVLTQGNWQTLVVDLAFDGEHPGLAGLRTVVQGSNDPSELGSYQQYGRFHGAESYSFRIEPGEEYPEGEAPVPANATGLLFHVYPHSHGWHATCEPPVEAGPCFLGLGAAVDVEFDLYVTAFYVDPAPDGWSLL